MESWKDGGKSGKLKRLSPAAAGQLVQIRILTAPKLYSGPLRSPVGSSLNANRAHIGQLTIVLDCFLPQNERRMRLLRSGIIRI